MGTATVLAHFCLEKVSQGYRNSVYSAKSEQSPRNKRHRLQPRSLQMCNEATLTPPKRDRTIICRATCVASMVVPSHFYTLIFLATFTSTMFPLATLMIIPTIATIQGDSSGSGSNANGISMSQEAKTATIAPYRFATGFQVMSYGLYRIMYFPNWALGLSRILD